MATVRIGEAARQARVPTHRLRHYEATGLLEPERTDSGYREYTAAHVDRARRIRALLEVGFNTADVALMLPCLEAVEDDDRRCCSVTRGRLQHRLLEIRGRREQLERTEKAISDWLDGPD